MRNNIPLLPEDLILDLLNNNEMREPELLMFYDGYIRASSVIITYNISGEAIIAFEEDLAQEMRINLINCLPALRKMLFEKKQQNFKTQYAL